MVLFELLGTQHRRYNNYCPFSCSIVMMCGEAIFRCLSATQFHGTWYRR